MKLKVLVITAISAICLSSCKETTKLEKVETITQTPEKIEDEIVTSSSTDKEGRKLEMSFNNTKDIATVIFNGESIEMVSQKPASGIWYKNDHYELTGKGDNIELLKDGKTIFIHNEDDSKVNDSSKTNVKQNKKTQVSSWWSGKQFENKRPVGANPEEGGADFLIINQNQTASYKVGDMVNEMTWKQNGATIVFKNKMTEKEIVFKINDSYLTDSYGTKWTVKK